MITDKTSPNSLYLIVRKPFEVLFGSKSNTKKRRSLLYSQMILFQKEITHLKGDIVKSLHSHMEVNLGKSTVINIPGHMIKKDSNR